ncbi:MAG TPA: condensation domain-containing protein, partial [Ktedonosporobacter sp.]|nr:condensation domain-containing protein [Ktedonosporobacter sp.]
MKQQPQVGLQEKRPDELPLSFAQQRLWFLDQFEPQNPSSIASSRIYLTGPLQVAALYQSLRTLEQRHEILRTNILTIEGRPCQRIAACPRTRLPLIDLSALPAQQQEQQVLLLSQQEALLPFSLAAGPLLRYSLLRLHPQRHLFLFSIHHILFDGWSRAIFWRELACCYEAALSQQPADLPPLPWQYADFALWQRRWLQGPVLQDLLAYWLTHLAQAPAVLDLPTDHPRPALQRFRGAMVHSTLSCSLSQALQALSQREGVTLFMTLLTGFVLVLARWSGQDDLIVGTPIANRTRNDIADLIGFFVNTLPLRIHLHGNPTLRQLLARVRDVALQGYAHQELPYEKLIEELAPQRDASRQALVQVAFVYQNVPAVQVSQMAQVRCESWPQPTQTAKFDLSLSVSETEQGLSVLLEYNSDLFEPTTAQRMLQQLQRVWQQMTRDLQGRVSAVSLLSEQERALLLGQGRLREPVREVGLQQELEGWAQRQPDAIALVQGEHQLSYGELNRRANQLGQYLRERGLPPEGRVGVCLPRSLELVIALLAILKAGGVYVPLDPSYPSERVSWLVRDARLSLLLTQRRYAANIDSREVDIICVDAEKDLIACQDIKNPVNHMMADSLLYIDCHDENADELQGAMHTYRGLQTSLHSLQQHYSLNETDRVLTMPASFRTSIWEYLWPLLSGACLVVFQPEGDQHPDHLMQYLAPALISVLSTTPSLLSALLENHNTCISECVRQIICIARELPTKFREQIPPHLSAKLQRAYEPAGIAPGSIFFAYVRTDQERLVSTSRFMTDAQVYLLDGYPQLVPIGIPGRLYIGERDLGRGYLHRPDITAERYIPDPFSQKRGARLYQTDEVARYLPDGTLEFLGSVHEYVWVGNFHVKLGWIETALLRHPHISSVVVLAGKDDAGNQRLNAYFTSEPERKVTKEELRRYLQGKLPDYMIPTSFIPLAFLPVTSEGKIEYHKLPMLELNEIGGAYGYVAPRTPLERLLGAIWEDVLKVKRVGIFDNFFALGGHSLLATQIISRIMEALAAEVSQEDFELEGLLVSTLFENPTIASLAEHIAVYQQQTQQHLQVPVLRPVPRSGPMPLSFAQQRLWFLDQLVPNHPFYNIHSPVRIRGPLQVAALQRSLEAIVHRHEALRTTFMVVDGLPMQVIAPASPLLLPTMDLSQLPEAQREVTLLQLAHQEVQQPFHLADGPLFRVTLLRLSKEEYVLLMTMHHIISDGWSMGIIWQELSTLYEAFSSGNSSPLSPLPLQYADVVVWQRQWLDEGALKAQLEYWKRQLTDALPVLDLPTDHPRPAVQTFRGAVVPFALSESLTTRLKILSQREGATLFMVLLATFQVLLYRYTGQEDISVGSPIANRTRTEFEHIVGFFANTLVLRTDLSGNPSFRELLSCVRNVALGAYAHQDLPFEKLVEELQPERDLSRNPLFQVMFALQNAPQGDLELTGLSTTSLKIANETTMFDLDLFMWEGTHGLRGTLRYSTDLFDNSTIIRLLKHFETLLESIVATPEQRLGELSLLTPQQRHQILSTFNATQMPLPQQSLVTLL